MVKFFVLGNNVLHEDGTAIRLLPSLQKEFPMHEFVAFDPNESIATEENLVFIDVVKGIEKVEVLTEKNVDSLRNFPKISMHDFDFTFQLKLLMLVGKIKNIRIIGIPYGMDDKTAFIHIARIIKNMF